MNINDITITSFKTVDGDDIDIHRQASSYLCVSQLK